MTDATPPIWRDPPQETEDYPGLWVHDGRMSGSITLGRTRGPVRCVTGWALAHPDLGITEAYPWADGDGQMAVARFISDLLEQRGEFARLLCHLADAERDERQREDRDEDDGRAWWEMPDQRGYVLAALYRCVTALESLAASPSREEEA